MMKKWISTILAVSMIVTMVAVLNACGKKKDDETPATTAAEDTTEETVTDSLHALVADDEPEEASYTEYEMTTDEHYEEEYEQLTLPPAAPTTKAAKSPAAKDAANAKSAAATTAAPERATTKPFQFAMGKDRAGAAASTNASATTAANAPATSASTTASSGSGAAPAVGSGGSGSAGGSGNAVDSGSSGSSGGSVASGVTDPSYMYDPAASVDAPSYNGTPSTDTRPQVNYLQKYVIDRLKGDSYTIRTDAFNAENGMHIPVTIYHKGDNVAYEMVVSNLMSEELKRDYPMLTNIAANSKVRFIIQNASTNPKMYLVLPTGYIDMQETAKEGGDDLSLSSDDMKEMFQEMSGGIGDVFTKETNQLEYIETKQEGANMIRESYLSPDKEATYHFYFTSEGLNSVKVVNTETGEVLQEIAVKIDEGIPTSGVLISKDPFNPGLIKMDLEALKKLFGNLDK